MFLLKCFVYSNYRKIAHQRGIRPLNIIKHKQETYPQLMQMNSHGRTCQHSSSNDVLISGSHTDRQIILELMAVLSCRLTMGYHFSYVNMQM